MHILCVNLDKIYLDNDFDEDNPDVIIVIKRLAWQSKFKKHKALKKKIGKELITIMCDHRK